MLVPISRFFWRFTIRNLEPQLYSPASDFYVAPFGKCLTWRTFQRRCLRNWKRWNRFSSWKLRPTRCQRTVWPSVTFGIFALFFCFLCGTLRSWQLGNLGAVGPWCFCLFSCLGSLRSSFGCFTAALRGVARGSGLVHHLLSPGRRAKVGSDWMELVRGHHSFLAWTPGYQVVVSCFFSFEFMVLRHLKS